MAISIDKMINTRLGDLIDPFIDKEVRDEWYEDLSGKYVGGKYTGDFIRAAYDVVSSDDKYFSDTAYVGGHVQRRGSILWDDLEAGTWGGEAAINIINTDFQICSDHKGKKSYWECLEANIDNTHIVLDADDINHLRETKNDCKIAAKMKTGGGLTGRKAYNHEFNECFDEEMRRNTDPDNPESTYSPHFADIVDRLENLDQQDYGVDFAKLSHTLYESSTPDAPFLGETGSELKFGQYFTAYDPKIEEGIVGEQMSDLGEYALEAMPTFEKLEHQSGASGFEETFGTKSEAYRDLYATGASKLGTETMLDILGERGRWAEDFYNTVADLAELDQFTT